MNEIQNELSCIDVLNDSDQPNESKMNDNEYKLQNKGSIKATSATEMMSSSIKVDGGKYTENVDHHDSDSDSFYNIWGDDEEWIYGNELRNVVRNLHR